MLGDWTSLSNSRAVDVGSNRTSTLPVCLLVPM